MNQHHAADDARASIREIGGDDFVVLALRNEVDSLNSLLAESANALNNLNEKVRPASLFL